MNISNLVSRVLSFSAVLTFVSCGSKSNDSSSASSCSSTAPSNNGGFVLCLGAATSTTLTLAGGSGQQYVVAPYTLGDIATVKGATDVNLAFKMTATSASLQNLQRSMPLVPAESESFDESEAMRMIVNHFDRRKGLDQPEWIWSTLKKLDLAQAAKINAEGSTQRAKSFTSSVELSEATSLTQHYKKLASTKLKSQVFEAPLTLANCPTSIPKVDNAAATFSATTSYDGTSFCIVYASSPISETKTKLQASVATILSSYQDTIYGDKFTANTAGGYSFNPVIVVVDPTVASMWPAGSASYKFTGAFSRDATTAAKRPIIYLMDDMSAVQSVDTTKAARLVHATLAHEMQHAIMDYYRLRGTTTKEETVAIDEGIAHTFEDAFGYGADNFESYVKPFLSSVPDGAPAMVTGTGYNAAAARGGANSFLYFLTQRAGGFTVTSNRPFSGAGMTALVNLVKQTAADGPAALQTAFGSSNLTEQVGQFFGAIFTDNRSFSFAPAIFTVSQYDSIADLQGNTDRTFGIRFNNFRDFTTAGTNALSDAVSFDLKHYGAFPVLVTPSAATATINLTSPGSANTGVAVIRVK